MAHHHPFPPALPHGPILPLFKDIYWVTGTVKMKAPHPNYGPLTLAFSRNMTIIRQGKTLTLINTVRLDEDALNELDKLGAVTQIIRIAGYHGMDDPFYQHRYKAKVYSIDAPYAKGFDIPPKPDNIYLIPDVILNEHSELPIADAKLLLFNSSTPKEALIYLERDNGIVISGDSLQHWTHADPFFNWPAKLMMRGFMREHGIGPGWVRFAKPDLAEVMAVMERPFEYLIPAHGKFVANHASTHYRASLEKLIKSQRA